MCEDEETPDGTTKMILLCIIMFVVVLGVAVLAAIFVMGLLDINVPAGRILA